jgi:hypothetical protein
VSRGRSAKGVRDRTRPETLVRLWSVGPDATKDNRAAARWRSNDPADQRPDGQAGDVPPSSRLCAKESVTLLPFAVRTGMRTTTAEFGRCSTLRPPAWTCAPATRRGLNRRDCAPPGTTHRQVTLAALSGSPCVGDLSTHHAGPCAAPCRLDSPGRRSMRVAIRRNLRRVLERQRRRAGPRRVDAAGVAADPAPGPSGLAPWQEEIMATGSRSPSTASTRTDSRSLWPMHEATRSPAPVATGSDTAVGRPPSGWPVSQDGCWL